MLLGPVTEGASADDVKLRVTVNGEEVAASEEVTEVTGDLDGLVKHVAKTLKAAGAVARARRHGDLRLDRPGARRRARATRSRSASTPHGSLTVSFE